MVFNTSSSTYTHDSRSSSRAECIEGRFARSHTPSGSRLFSSLTRSRPASPAVFVPAHEIERSQSQLNMSNFASLERVVSDQSEALARPSSRDSRYLGGEGQRQPTLARSLFHKSSRLLQKRKSVARIQGGSFWEDEDTLQRVTPEARRRYLTKQRSFLINQESVLKHAISDPFNFQHVTHTNPHQARVLATTNDGKLVTEFCAMRAAQKPRTELKGIKAEDLPSGANSEVVSLATPSTYHTPEPSRPTTPGRERPLQVSKSIDNFALMADASFTSTYPPLHPPPRRSSRKPAALAGIFVNYEVALAQDSPTLPGFSTAPPPLAVSPVSQYTVATVSTPATSLSYFDSPVEIAQAVSTPDDSACEFVPRPPLPPIPTEEPIPEDDQQVISRQNSTASRPKSLRHTRSFPSVKHFSRCFASTPTPKDENSISDPVLPLPDFEQEDIPTQAPGRSSTAPKSMHESWEDSVDYCYDFAMEDDEHTDKHSTAAAESESQQTVHSQKSMNSMSQPELSDSATSSAVSVPGTITPSEPLPSPGLLTVPRDSQGAVAFRLSASFLVPDELHSYEEELSRALSRSESKTPYSCFETTIDADVQRNWSSCSSDDYRPFGLSKSSSHDSLGASGAPSSRHRHSSSIGSIPELVKSQSSRERLPVKQALAAYTSGVSDLTSTIAGLRGDLIRAAEDMPEEEFAFVSPTLTPPPTKLTFGPTSPADMSEPSRPPPAAPINQHPPRTQHARASSSAQNAQIRQRGRSTSYSLFPGASTRM